MLKHVSRHYIVLVLEICLIFFQVFLNNEKPPFILELSSNNQMYLSIINVIYSVPPNKSFFFCLNMVFLFLCNRQSSFTAQGYSQKCTFIHCPWSSLTQMMPQRTLAHKQSSTMSCVKKKITKKHSNALKLKCASGSNSKVSCQFWRKVSK